MVEEHIVHGPKPLIPISTDSLGLTFYNHFKSNPEEVAISDSFRKLIIKNKDVLKYSCCLAVKLKQLDLNENDVIGVCTDNEIELLYVIIASLFLGIAVTLFNPRYTHHEITNCVKISKPKIIFCSSTSWKILNKMPSIEKLIIINSSKSVDSYESFESFITNNVNEGDLQQFSPIPVDVNEKVAFILYSSGTTGLPKGVCLTHKNVNALIALIFDPRFQEVHSGKTTVGILPFFHAAGLFVMLLNLLKRKEVIVLKSFDPDIYLKTLQDNNVEYIQGVPTIANFLATSPLVEKYNLSLKCFTSGSAALSPYIARKLSDRFQLTTLFQKYGMTELSCGATTPTVSNNKFGSCGRIYPYMLSKVVDPDTGKTLSAFKAGELYFKGPQVMKEYKNNEAATREAIDKDGWLRTGDKGYYDADGNLYVVGRLKELIKYKEFQVPPAELEAILISHPKILDAVVVGLPDEQVGEIPFAFVVKTPNELLTEKEVQEFVAGKVSSPKRLRGGVVFVKEIPKTSTGKNSKPKIKEMLSKL